MSELFPPEFVSAIARMRLHAGMVPRGGRQAEHGSAQLGSGMEFRDFRPYLPGDDLKRIDWNLYQRSGSLFIRLFEEERDLPVYILLDCSDSMFFEDPLRANAAKQAAAVLIGAALNQHDRPSLLPFGNRLQEGFPAIPSRRALPSTLAKLEGLGPAGATRLPGVLDRLKSLRLRRGVVALISDCFDPEGIEAMTNGLHGLPHKLLILRLSRQSDANPDIEGEMLLDDCETGGGVLVHATPRVLEDYRQRFADFEHRLLEFTRRRQAGYLVLDSERDVLEQFAQACHGGAIKTHG